MEKIIIFGGTGFLGMSLAKYLSKKGYEPVLIARNTVSQNHPFKFQKWDAVTVGEWVSHLNGAKAVVNLVGKSVDCIKTPANCDLILRSRVDSTKIIGEGMKQVENPPKVWIQMSTAHIYGDPPLQVCSEESSTGYGLAPFVGKAWEEAFFNAIQPGIRGVVLRTSFVIGKHGGALKSLKRLVKLGLGGKAGNGKQGISWIHETDLNGIIYQSIVNEKFQGIYISSAPNPVSNKEFMKTLRKSMKFPFGIPSPAFLVKFGAFFLFKTDPDLALYGRYVVSQRLETHGFEFTFPNIDEALKDIFSWNS